MLGLAKYKIMRSEYKSKKFLLWGLANLFFAFQFILRLSAGILREDIIQKFSIDAASFGTLAGYYYIGYAGSQIPLGIMLDRISFRFVTALSITTAAIGTLTFVATDNWNIVLLGRFLIGVGSGVAFLSVAKVTKVYFDEKYHSMILGLSFTFGLSGAVFGMTPMKYVFDMFGYNYTFNMLAIICFILAALIMLFGTIDSQDSDSEDKQENILWQIIALITKPRILLISVSGGLMVGALEGFADVWAIAYFEQIFNMSSIDSALVTSCIYIGMCCGGPIVAFLAKIIGSENITIFIIGVLSIIVFAIIFYTPSMGFYNAAFLMFFLGILCCYQVLVFSVTSKSVSSQNEGLAIATVNCINMVFGHFFHQLIASTIQSGWDGMLSVNGSAVYSRDIMVTALAFIPIGCFIGQLGFAFLSTRMRKS